MILAYFIIKYNKKNNLKYLYAKIICFYFPVKFFHVLANSPPSFCTDFLKKIYLKSFFQYGFETNEYPLVYKRFSAILKNLVYHRITDNFQRI